MTSVVRHIGEAREVARWEALDWAARELAPALNAAHEDVEVSVRPTFILGAPSGAGDRETELGTALTGVEGPFRIQSANAVAYVGAPRLAAAHALELMAEAAADAEDSSRTGVRDVVIQPYDVPVRNDRRYPTLTGELSTENAYPISYLDPKDGVARVVFGAGDDLATRADALRFCPRHPDLMPDFSQPDDVLRNGQKVFHAVSGPPDALVVSEHPLDVARADRTLDGVGGVVSIENQTIYPGVHRDGVRTVTCAMLLRGHPFAFAPLLADAVERLRDAPASLGGGGGRQPWSLCFALVLPATGETARPRLVITDLHEVPRPDAPAAPDAHLTLLTTETALGLGAFEETHDLVYVPPERFDVARSREIAAEIAAANAHLTGEGRRFVLIVPGRLGSTDRSLGVPVRWRDISSASVQIEVALDDFNVEESHGTHFFRELTGHGVGYLHVSLAQRGAVIHWDRLASLAAAYEGTFVRHVRLDEPPLRIWIDGANARGIVAVGAH